MRIKQPIERKLVQANVCPEYWIKESDLDQWHIELTRMTIIPGKQDAPQFSSFVQTFSPAEWERLAGLDGIKNPVNWMKASLVHSYKIVHNPLIIK